ncbi:MAG: hypothetical protein MRJ96_13310 [Nitrospirales bacterium]|nr:hypothetical protein [Nitrospirales bacterium]
MFKEADPQTQIQELQRACPDLNPLIIQDFVERMDPDYFAQFSPTTISQHVTHISHLTIDHPFKLEVDRATSRRFQLTFIAYDYFSEFATLCGLLSSAGLDIRNATIFTYTEKRTSDGTASQTWKHPPPSQLRPPRSLKPSPGLSRKKVVDVFNVQLLKGCVFGPQEQTLLRQSIHNMLHLLEKRHFREVRREVNRHLIETLGKIKSHVSTVIHPVEIAFDNTRVPDATAMDIRSTDTPAFLYTFANALTMRGIYIAKAKIEVKDHTAHNVFHVRGRTGGKIENPEEQQDLSSTAALIKEFSHFLTWAPDPGKALEHFDQLLDELRAMDDPALTPSLLRQQSLLSQLAKVFGSSDFLWEDLLRRQHANLLPVMTQFQDGSIIRSKADLAHSLSSQMKRCSAIESRRARLNTFKDQELFRIDIKHMLEPTSLQDFSQALTNLAETILDKALEEALSVHMRRQRVPRKTLSDHLAFAIFGLGKLGGAELGYASDIEVLFVYDVKKPLPGRTLTFSPEFFEQLVQEILCWIEAKKEGIFHIDTRLRPYGEKGLLANSFQELCAYYDSGGSAAPFERQALIKLRHVAGDRALGEKVEAQRDRFVYSSTPWDLESAIHLRTRQIKELVPAGATHVKYSPGGLIDIEYLIQYLQIIYGSRLASLRHSNTLKALEALCRRKLIKRQEAHTLREDYLFFRQLIDALRIVRGNARDLLLPEPESDSIIFLARRLGFITPNWKDGAETLEKTIHDRMKRTQKIFRDYFGQKSKDS